MDKTNGLVVRQPGVLSTTTGALEVFRMIRAFKFVDIRKVGPKELQMVFRDKLPEAIDALRTTLEEADDEEANELWQRCKQPLKYELLMADDRTFSEDIYQRFELEPVFACKAFLYHHHTVHDTPYGRSFVQFDGDIVTRFTHLLTILPKELAIDMVRATNKKVLYLLYVWEFDEFERYDDLHEEVGDATSWLRNGAPPNQDQTPFLFWLWENDYDLYQEGLVEFFNPGYIEIRELFYEVRDRTLRWREAQDQVVDPDVDEITSWLNSDD